MRAPDGLKRGDHCAYLDKNGTEWLAVFEHMTKPGRCKIRKATDESGARKDLFVVRYVESDLVARHGFTTPEATRRRSS